jgi:hypothetical protein
MNIEHDPEYIFELAQNDAIEDKAFNFEAFKAMSDGLRIQYLKGFHSGVKFLMSEEG